MKSANNLGSLENKEIKKEHEQSSYESYSVSVKRGAQELNSKLTNKSLKKAHSPSFDRNKPVRISKLPHLR